jgi:hypothetical protein
MSQLCTIRAEEVRPGDVIVFDEPDFIMDVGQTTRTRTGYVGFYARGGEWSVYRKADDDVQVRIGQSIAEEVDPPFDWQDRFVMWGSGITGVLCLAILIWGPK